MRRKFLALLLSITAVLGAAAPAHAAGTFGDTGAGKANSTTTLGTLDDGVTVWESLASTVYTQAVGRLNEQIYFPSPASGVAISLRAMQTGEETHIIGATWNLPSSGSSPYDRVLQMVRITDAGSFVAVSFSRTHYNFVEYINGQTYVDLQPVSQLENHTWPAEQTTRQVTLAANGDTVYLYSGDTLVDSMVVSSRASKAGFGSLLNYGGMAGVRVDDIAVASF